MKKRHDSVGIPWLFDELPDLVDQQVINDQTATALQEHYRPRLVAKDEPDNAARLMHSYAGPLLTAFAALLVAGGMILILAHNWQELSREMRAAIAILPALFGLVFAAWILLREKSRSWREFAGIWLMITAYSSLGIIAQTYHLGGKFATFMMIVTLTTLFVPLVLRSLGASIIQLVGFVAWGFAISSLWRENLELGYTLALSVGLLLGPLPYYLSTLADKNRWERMFDAIAIVITAYFLTPTLLSQFVDNDRLMVALLLAAAAVLLLIGRWIKQRDTNRISFPWQVGGWLGIGIISLILNIDSIRGYTDENLISWWAFPIVALVPYGIWRISQRQWFEGMVGLLPAAVYVAMLMGYHNLMVVQTGDLVRYNPFTLLISGVFILFSLLGAILGFTKKDFGILNGAMAILLLAIVIRFFDGDYSALARGIAFISSGLTILVVNLVANRLFRKKLEPITKPTK